jgi:hypothetical protein
VSNWVFLLPGIAASAGALVVLARRDPMRLRVLSAREPPPAGLPSALATGPRRAWAAVALAPGPLLALIGGWGTFAIWAGAILVCGWTVAVAMNRERLTGAGIESQAEGATTEPLR